MLLNRRVGWNSFSNFFYCYVHCYKFILNTFTSVYFVRNANKSTGRNFWRKQKKLWEQYPRIFEAWYRSKPLQSLYTTPNKVILKTYIRVYKILANRKTTIVVVDRVGKPNTHNINCWKLQFRCTISWLRYASAIVIIIRFGNSA